MREHAVEIGQGENGFRWRGIGDRGAVGGEDAAAETGGAFRHLAPDPAIADNADGAPQHLTMRGPPPICGLAVQEPARNAVTASNRRWLRTSIVMMTYSAIAGS